MPLLARLLSFAALALPLFVGAHRMAAAQLPAAPTPLSSVQAAAGSIAGIVTDLDGDAVPGARITLTRPDQPAPTASVTSGSDGAFLFSNLPPGPFTLSLAADGFAPAQTSGSLTPGQDLELPDFALRSATTTTVEVDADQVQIAQIEINQEEKQRVLGVVPNFFIVYDSDPVSLTAKQKFSLANRTQIDPFSFAIVGVLAGIEQAGNDFAWGQGARAYGKRYAAAYGTFLTGNYLTDAVLPSIFHQDPRYYYKGTGTARSRVGYAIANAVVCKGDNHRWQPNYSGFLGGLAASGLSNVYYPAANRDGAALTFEGAALGTGFAAVANLAQEFLIRRLTPHSLRAPTQ